MTRTNYSQRLEGFGTEELPQTSSMLSTSLEHSEGYVYASMPSVSSRWEENGPVDRLGNRSPANEFGFSLACCNLTVDSAIN